MLTFFPARCGNGGEIEGSFPGSGFERYDSHHGFWDLPQLSAHIRTAVDIQYATVLAVLYASYVPSQIPSNMVNYDVHLSAARRTLTIG